MLYSIGVGGHLAGHFAGHLAQIAQGYDNNNDFFYANILEDQAQWYEQIKGLSNRKTMRESLMDERRC